MDIAANRDLDLSQPKAKPKEHAKPSTTALTNAIPRLYGYFYPRAGGHRALAEDLTQDTLLAAVRSGNTPNEPDQVMPWLFSIARNKLIDHYRKQDRELRNLGQQVDEDDLGIQPGLPDLDLESLPLREEVIATLGQINPRFQAAIVLRYFDGCDIATVAQTLFLSESATTSLLARARNAFRSTWIIRNGEAR